ncbi:MAG TPA: hypothetical protein VGJ57_11570 [Nitrospirales bacterium]
MSWRLLLAAGLLVILPLLGASAEEDSSVRNWQFDNVPAGQLPPHFVLGTFFDGRPAGDWKVMKTPQAVSLPNVLAQLREKGAEHTYNVVLIDDAQAANLDLSVFFLPISGKADMGGGLIWRAQDDRNYYLTRANPLEQNIRVYQVVNGVRKMLKNHDEIIDIRKWHRLHVVNQGCRIQVFYDDKPIFDLCDETFKQGRIGLWTKSDAVTYFDDLRLQILKSSP